MARLILPITLMTSNFIDKGTHYQNVHPIKRGILQLLHNMSLFGQMSLIKMEHFVIKIGHMTWAQAHKAGEILKLNHTLTLKIMFM